MKLLIDGNNLAYRANATSDLTTSKGERVSAIYGSLQMIQSYLKPSQGKYKNKLLDSLNMYLDEDDLRFTDVVTCWDLGKSKQRTELYPEYKAHRRKNKEERSDEEKEIYQQLLDQMNTLHEVLPNFGVKSIRYKDYEGDDLIYAATQLFTEDICVIVSTDKDMLQLVSDKIFVWSPQKAKLITPRNFPFETGVKKSLYLDYRVIVGDSSDNIKGLYRIGDKTAKSLFQEYGDIAGIMRNTDKLTPSRKKAFEEGTGIIDRNRLLMDLNNLDYSEIKEDLEEKLLAEVNYDNKEVKMFLASKQMTSILSDYLSWSAYFKMLGN